MNSHRAKQAKCKAVLPNGRARKTPTKFEDLWAKVHVHLVIHPAWRHLSSSAKDVLIVSIVKASYSASKGIKNNAGHPKFQFTYAEAENLLRMPSPTFNHAMDELKERGFIGVSDPGGTMNGKGRPAKYFLSDKWKEWKAPVKSTKNIDKARAARKCGNQEVSLIVDLSQEG